MLTRAGAKLLDFGLAKLKGHGEQPAAAHLASAPTQSTPLTGGLDRAVSPPPPRL